MKIKYFTLTIVFLLFSTSLIGQSKVGTINVNEVLLQLPEFKQIEKETIDYKTELEKTLNEKVTNYKTKLENYKKNSETYSDVMNKTMGKELFDLENDIKNFQQNGVKLSQLRRDDLLRPLYKKISDMITTVAKEQKYTQILTIDGNEFVYIDEEFDITGTVKEKLGTTK